MSENLWPFLLPDLILQSARRFPERAAVVDGEREYTYRELAIEIKAFAAGLLRQGLRRGDRVGIFLNKRIEFVIASFGTALAGGVFVPINPALRSAQVFHIISDCSVMFVVTAQERLALLKDFESTCPSVRAVILVNGDGERPSLKTVALPWAEFSSQGGSSWGTSGFDRHLDSDMVAILYTSGSTGRPKGVILSHRNMVVGARSVAQYLGNTKDDVILAALPFSFDAGFSQMTTAFSVGAKVVLLDYLLPKEFQDAVIRFGVTGITAVPPLWIQVSDLQWPHDGSIRLRYFANTGGRMPLEILTRLRAHFPGAEPYLMYGLTEAFRATYLPPAEVDRRPDSIGRAIPNAEVLVLRENGEVCDDDEPGELVQRGALVAMGYWNNPEATAERFRRPLLGLPSWPKEVVLPEIAVFSGDVVRRDREGFLYFIGRRDEMIKTSGYRVSPTEIEEMLYQIDGVAECAVFGRAHEILGQTIVAVVYAKRGVSLGETSLVKECRRVLPLYMVPSKVYWHDSPLPRNPNGKIDRKFLAEQYGS